MWDSCRWRCRSAGLGISAAGDRLYVSVQGPPIVQVYDVASSSAGIDHPSCRHDSVWNRRVSAGSETPTDANGDPHPNVASPTHSLNHQHCHAYCIANGDADAESNPHRYAYANAVSHIGDNAHGNAWCVHASSSRGCANEHARFWAVGRVSQRNDAAGNTDELVAAHPIRAARQCYGRCSRSERSEPAFRCGASRSADAGGFLGDSGIAWTVHCAAGCRG